MARSHDDLFLPEVATQVADCAIAVPGEPTPRREPVEDRMAPAMASVYRLVARIARGTLPVLIVGETGVGKEFVAEAIHGKSPRAKARFLRLNCAALPEPLLESELFGHERGAFTGADKTKQGLLESAHGGTVFLDEVGELPPAIQAKLLRVLEDGCVLRVGSLSPRSIDVRFVSATNRDLEHEVASGRFRADLYFRLGGITVAVPPLRDRIDEIAPLARLLLQRAASKAGVGPPRLSPEVTALLERYGWPGNVRELRNFMERVVLLADDVVLPEHLPPMKADAGWAEPASTRRSAAASSAALAERFRQDQHALERRYLEEALRLSDGNQRDAAELLGMARRTFQYRIAQHGLKGWKDRG